MAQWTSEELQGAFQHYQDTVVRAGTTPDWNLFAELFTPDAVYIEHTFGTFHGREEIRGWIVRTMTTFPGSSMPHFPISWHVIDVERGRIVCEILNRMADPGDGSIHEETNITILTYAGNNQFSSEEDVYNPAKFGPMVLGWCRRAKELGTLPVEGEPFLAAAG